MWRTMDLSARPEWSTLKKIIFRITFVFLVLFCIPTDPDWYSHLFKIDWTNLHARDLYDIAHISPHFVESSRDGRWGIGGFITWFWVLLIAVGVAAIWTVLDRKRREYDVLYYWLRTLVRYRAALGIIGFSFEKIFPTQMPYPSLSNLATNFGDFSGHKIYWTSIGFMPQYQVFGGFVELIPGILLLFRRTATLGAALLIGALTTIAIANLGYDGGVHVYASYFVLLGLFLLADAIPDLYNLLIREQYTIPNHYKPLETPALNYTRLAVKGIFAFYIVVFSYLQFLNFRYDPYKQPSTAGVSALRGVYDVEIFRLNNKELPYSQTDSVRWQEVIFEDWTTLTYKVNKALDLELSNSGGGTSSSKTGHSSVDLEKGYEIAGVGGGRRAFHYFADTTTKTLYLLDKNLTASKKKKSDVYSKDWISAQAWKHIGDDNHLIDPKAWSTRRDRDFAKMDPKLLRDKMLLRYSTEDGNKIILSGTNENNDSLYVVLKKINRGFIIPPPVLVSGSY
ncbi:hypothetical protein [Cytophaga hutchinsonii]|nr:hypothetical protein [Cytophaga hutchinsonii]SFX07029.1 hypothetical protein SAMN04487930_101393 [Cytophaga hutchinsonii ATCC 33406]